MQSDHLLSTLSSLYPVRVVPKFLGNCECMATSMKIIFTGKLGVVDVNSSVLMLVPFMLLKLKSKTPTHCRDIHINFCVFCERVAPSCRNLTVDAVFMFVLSIGQFISACNKASHQFFFFLVAFYVYKGYYFSFDSSYISFLSEVSRVSQSCKH